MYHRTLRGPERKAFLATPAYQGVGAGFAYAYISSATALADAGIVAEPAIFAGDCHVDDSRNRLVRDFLESDCEDLVFLDADLRWEPEDLVRLLQYDRDVIAASYPFRQGEENYPIRFLPGEIRAEEDGAVEVEGVPTGFLRIKRHVLETLADRAVKFKPKSDQRGDIPLIFERQVHDGFRWGGDYTFCRKWRDLGGRIYVDPEVSIEHSGSDVFQGSLGSWLRRKNGTSIAYCLHQIAEGKDTPATYLELVREWDNEWAAGPEMLAVCAAYARRHRNIIEAGSGLTSLVMAATGANVTALEHNHQWASRLNAHGLETLSVVLTPIADGWYVVPDTVSARTFDMGVADGPPRHLGHRAPFASFKISGPIVADDIDDLSQVAWLKALASRDGRAFQEINGTRRFAVLREKQ